MGSNREEKKNISIKKILGHKKHFGFISPTVKQGCGVTNYMDIGHLHQEKQTMINHLNVSCYIICYIMFSTL